MPKPPHRFEVCIFCQKFQRIRKIQTLYLKGDGLARQGLHKNLHDDQPAASESWPRSKRIEKYRIQHLTEEWGWKPRSSFFRGKSQVIRGFMFTSQIVPPRYSWLPWHYDWHVISWEVHWVAGKPRSISSSSSSSRSQPDWSRDWAGGATVHVDTTTTHCAFHWYYNNA